MSETPKPAESPRPPLPPLEEPQTDPGAPVTKGEMRRSFRINEIYTFLVASGVAVGAVFGAYKLLLNEAEAAGAKGAEGVERRVATLEQQRRQDREDVHELAKDIRELYRVMPVIRRSERLEKPVGDGGQ